MDREPLAHQRGLAGVDRAFADTPRRTTAQPSPGLSCQLQLPLGDTGLTRRDGGIPLILIEELPKQVTKFAIHLGNPGLTGVQLASASRLMPAGRGAIPESW